MVHIIIFSVIALAIFVITFLKLIKENNSNYIFTLVPEFIGLLIDFICIFLTITPNFVTIIIMYILSVIIPIIGFLLEKSNINLLEIFNIFKVKYYENKNQIELAKQILLKNVQKHPNSYLSHKMLAEWYEKNNEKEKAEYEYIKIIELKPKNLENYLKLANIYKQNEKDEESIKILQEVLKKKPEYMEASILLGDILYENDMFKEAVGIYQEAIRYNPGEYKLYYSMGMTYTRLNDFQNAKEYYKKAATINSMINVAKLNLGQISLIFKDYEEAEKYFMECIETDDDKIQSEAYYYLAKIKLINNQNDLAIQYANISLELNPKMIKVMEKDIYFGTIIGKLQLKEDKKIESKINEKEEDLINYLNNTYEVVEKLTQNDAKSKNKEINKEREI